jgi:hypothetical protein
MGLVDPPRLSPFNPFGITFDRPFAVWHLPYSLFATRPAGKIVPLTSPNPIR